MKRKKALETRKPLQARPETARAWQRRSRGRLPQRSARRIQEAPRRAEVRQAVLDRDRACRAARLAPGPCRSPFPDRPVLEVHEVISRARWAEGYLVVENCLALCQVHHDWVTTHPEEAEALGLSATRPNPG